MKKGLKFLLWAGGLLVVLLIVCGIALKFYFNEARLRALLLPPVREALGREVDISTISIDLFRGIKVGDFVVKEADGKTDFVTIKELGLSYSLLPLLEKRLEIGRVWLEKPAVNVWRNRDGSFNFSDLQVLQSGKPASNGEKASKLSPVAENSAAQTLPIALVVQRCDISGANVTFVDKAEALPQVNLTADLKTKLDLGDLTPESINVDGELKFALQAEHKSLTPSAAGTVKFDRRKIVYKVDIKQQQEACTLSGSLTNYLEATPELLLDIDAQRLDLAYLAGLGQQLSGSGNGVKKTAAGKSEKKVTPAAGNLPVPQLKAAGKIDIKQAVYENYQVDDFFLRYTFDGVSLALSDLSGKFADGLFTGAAVVKPLLKQPEFKGNFSLSDLNLAALLAMAKPEFEGRLSGTGAGEFVFSGRSGPSKTLQQSLSLDGKFSLRQAGMRKLPLTSALAQVLMMPQLEELKMDEFAGNLKIRKGKIKLNSNWHGDQLSGSAIGDIGLDGSLKLPVDLVLSQNLSAKLAPRYVWVKETFNDKGEAEVSIYLDGSVSQPKLRLNHSKATRRLQKKLEDKLLQKLNERLDDGKSETAGESGKDKPEDLLRNFLQKQK